MLPALTRRQSRLIQCRRVISTESAYDSSSTPPPIPPPNPNPPRPKTRLTLQPRPHDSSKSTPLPRSFGQNQLLSVSSTKRALLESIVSNFNAPIRYAFAYGSGVFEQDGQGSNKLEPMLDFVFAVTHSQHWHSINMQQHPSHYPLNARTLGSSFVSRIQDIGPGVWFNAYIPMQGVMIKYGVTSVDTLSSDLLNWNTLYMAGRMHKPIRIINVTPNPRITLNQQVNLASAARHSLLLLPEEFTEVELFERIAGLSYMGDPRMMLPAENRGKVKNIVSAQTAQFRELYQRLIQGLPGIHWETASGIIHQDVSPRGRAAHLKKLPSNLLRGIEQHFDGKEADESAYWVRMAGDGRLQTILLQETSKIIRYPSTVQSIKGIVSAGVGKSVMYAARKVNKWWQGS